MTPFQSNFGTNTAVNSIAIANFITGVTTSPTPDTGSYARYQKIGSLVQIEFKYKFLTTGSGAMSINLPVPINTNYPKPQSIFHIRYIGGGGQVHYGFYNEKDANSIDLVAQTTFGGVPASFTQSSPDTLTIGDILTGLVFYETS